MVETTENCEEEENGDQPRVLMFESKEKRSWNCPGGRPGGSGVLCFHSFRHSNQQQAMAHGRDIIA